MLKRRPIIGLILFFVGFSLSYANDDLISLFPLNNYDQRISTWLKPTATDYQKPLLTDFQQKKQLSNFYKHFFGANSPWDAKYVENVLHQPEPNDIKSQLRLILQDFNNNHSPIDKVGYGENFVPYSANWIKQIEENINFDDVIRYQSANRAIAIENLHARLLPTDDPHFYSYKFAGQGYPFDNLQLSSIWIGTPLYIISQTRDHSWTLVLTPDFIGWVKSNGIAHVTSQFVKNWRDKANKQLAAIIKTATSLTTERNEFLSLAYVGTVLPAKKTPSGIELAVPIMGENRNAQERLVTVSDREAALMPLAFTPRHLANVMTTLIGRPYGWGNMYFYNDCSAELKNLFTPFGIWLPRHSSHQVITRNIDLSAQSPEERLAYLMKNGLPLKTIVYVGGHILLYVGQVFDQNHNLSAMTYQNVWGLAPFPATRRAVIGRSVFLPMLLRYPEDPSLVSLAAKKYFQITYLTIPIDYPTYGTPVPQLMYG